ncbi:MAG: HugZ family protein [Acidimicrobiia bacterium]
MTTGHIIPGWEEEAAPSDSPQPPPPEPSHAERARTVVAAQTRGALSTLAVGADGAPFGSVVTYGVDTVGRPSFFVSTMAEHTRNLDADPRASLLVVEETAAGADPLASARVTLMGTAVEVVDPEERAAARAGYLAANPNAFYVDYGDFRCLRLEVTGVRYVGGFGRMSWVGPAEYAAAEADPLHPVAAGILGHMNADHADALATLVAHFGGEPEVTGASMTAVDRYGFEVVARFDGDRRQAVRIGFRAPQSSADDVRKELIGMLAEARAGG